MCRLNLGIKFLKASCKGVCLMIYYIGKFNKDSVFSVVWRKPGSSELRWKQVKVLHGPATVRKERCP